MSDQTTVTDGTKPVQKTTTVGLYPEDFDAVERIRTHYKLENFGQAVRRSIRETLDIVEREQEAKAA